MQSFVHLEQVQQKFSKKMVLEDITLSVNKGEIIGLLGPSGSGKTTLVKGIVGMSVPNKGEIYVAGKKMPSLKACRQIGYMAQSDALYEDLSARDNLLYFGALYGIKGAEAKQRTKELLNLVKLAEDAKKPVRHFSGGMKRRLSLAIALFHHPPLLILDEPTVGIDPVLRKEFWKEFKRLKEMGAAIMITTHVMDEAEHCDRLAFLRNGRITAAGNPAELMEEANAESIEDAFLYFGKGGEV